MKTALLAAIFAAAMITPALTQAAAAVGQPAPALTAIDTQGRTVSLSDYKGKTVVLEWVNPGCPFVQKHYDSGNMPATQKEALAKGVVWLTINSTAKGTGDYLPPAELASWQKGKGATPTATLMDADGKVGRTYGARTTPHMFVIDPQGRLAYAGAIDSKPTANRSDIAGATNYVKQAVSEVTSGKPVSHPSSTAYGCSVKYAG